MQNLEIMAADVENTYLTAPCREKHWIVAGPEFEQDEGKTFIVIRALYGLKNLVLHLGPT